MRTILAPSHYRADERLAVYGSLAPGRANAHILEPLEGSWFEGSVRGRLFRAGWGAAAGYPGIHLDPQGEEVAILLFCSRGLPAFWEQLDAFEGADYRRVQVEVTLARGERLAAQIYELARERQS